MVGHLSGAESPADGMTKLFKDPIAIIISQLYREGPAKFGSIDTLREDVVATCTNGKFTFHGLPSKFLAEDSKSESDACNLCGETLQFCGLVMTRNRAKHESMENKIEEGEIEIEIGTMSLKVN